MSNIRQYIIITFLVFVY